MAANSLHNNLYLPDQVPLDLVFFLQGQDPGVAKIEKGPAFNAFKMGMRG